MERTPLNPISNRKLEQALNHGITTITLAWPVDVFGVYGANKMTDADLDAYVRNVAQVNQHVKIVSIVPGRTKNLKPVIVVKIAPREFHWVWTAETGMDLGPEINPSSFEESYIEQALRQVGDMR